MNDLTQLRTSGTAEKPRTVELPPDFVAALDAARLLETFEAMSNSHRKEWTRAIADAKRAETRAKRIRDCVEAMRSRSAG